MMLMIVVKQSGSILGLQILARVLHVHSFLLEPNLGLRVAITNPSELASMAIHSFQSPISYLSNIRLWSIAREEFAGVTTYARLILLGRCCLEFGRDNCKKRMIEILLTDSLRFHTRFCLSFCKYDINP